MCDKEQEALCNRPVGVFDSGVGGLTVAREIMRQLPNERIVYFGDTARLPYGSKSRDTIIRYSRQIIRFLQTMNVKAIVIACNTASAYALETLQKELDLPIIGVVKPGARVAAQETTGGNIGVIGTEVQAPMPTVTAIDHNALIAANLVEYFSTGRPISVEEPMHTVTSHDREALTLTHICEFKGQDIGQDQRKPLRTITASAGEFAEIRTEVRTYEPGADMGHWPEVRALLNRFCGYDLKENEVLTLDVGGTAYFVADIGLRMLTPRELYNAMGFPPDYIIDRDYTGRAYGKSKQVARCGNAVCPPMAEAVVRANLPEWCGKKLRTMEELERAVSA